MAEHGNPISLYQLSNTSEDESSDHNALTINADHGGASGWTCPHHLKLPPSSSIDNQLLPPPQKRPRGRPAGSKNKPKPPLIITQNNEESLKSVVIKVGVGFDVMQTLVEFARRRNVGISVLSGSGSVASVTLHNPLLSSPPFTLHGPFTLLSFTGTYFSGSSHSSFTFPDATTSSSSALNPTYSSSINTSSFGISLLGSQGHIFGGVVAGKIVAASTVTVTATVFTTPELYEVGTNENNEDGDLGDKDHNLNANGNGTMSKFMNHQSSCDVNQWGQIHSSNGPRNY